MGRLWRCLAQGEYGQLHDCPLFESDFMQVTWSGEVASQVTVGIAATSPLLPLPNLMLLARPVPASPPDTEELQLFGLLPLSCVRLSLHSHRCHQLRARLATGRTFYLQLLAPPRHLQRLFACWIRLLFLLRDPGGCPPGPPSPQGLPGVVGDPGTPLGTGRSRERQCLPPNKRGRGMMLPPHDATWPPSKNRGTSGGGAQRVGHPTLHPPPPAQEPPGRTDGPPLSPLPA